MKRKHRFGKFNPSVSKMNKEAEKSFGAGVALLRALLITNVSHSQSLLDQISHSCSSLFYLPGLEKDSSHFFTSPEVLRFSVLQKITCTRLANSSPWCPYPFSQKPSWSRLEVLLSILEKTIRPHRKKRKSEVLKLVQRRKKTHTDSLAVIFAFSQRVLKRHHLKMFFQCFEVWIQNWLRSTSLHTHSLLATTVTRTAHFTHVYTPLFVCLQTTHEASTWNCLGNVASWRSMTLNTWKV